MKGKKVLVVGAGRSGMAVSRFLLGKGARVVLADEKPNLHIDAGEFPAGDFQVVSGQYPEVGRGQFDFMVMSPGVPLTVAPAQKAVELGIGLIGELELAYLYAPSPFVAITGTNGKTTTTSLTGEIFQNSGRNTLVGGNIGLPLVTEVEKYGPGDIIVAEVSSFQLETAERFCPKVAAILNVTPDHLDRHGSMEGYTEAKARIFMNQGPGDYTVFNYDDPIVRDLALRTKGKVIFFSRRHNLEQGVWVRDGIIVSRIEKNAGVPENTGLPGECPVTEICLASELFIKGAHNLENALAATACALALGVQPQVIAETLRTFRGVAHRMEFVAEINGVKYVNDSKGTNPDASIKALISYEEPIVLIAGGRNKGSDFSEFAAVVKDKVRRLVLVGEASGDIEKAVREVGFTAVSKVSAIPEAVKSAAQIARPGDVVLLSPACASWDMFNNFEERGDLFKKVVNGLRRF